MACLGVKGCGEGVRGAVGAEAKMPKASRREEYGRGFQPTREFGEHRELPSHKRIWQIFPIDTVRYAQGL